MAEKLVDVLQHYLETQIGRRSCFSRCYIVKPVCCVFLVDFCNVHPCFSLKDIGVEEAQNWLIVLVKRGTSQTDREGLENSLCTP